MYLKLLLVKLVNIESDIQHQHSAHPIAHPIDHDGHSDNKYHNIIYVTARTIGFLFNSKYIMTTAFSPANYIHIILSSYKVILSNSINWYHFNLAQLQQVKRLNSHYETLPFVYVDLYFFKIRHNFSLEVHFSYDGYTMREVSVNTTSLYEAN